MINEFNSLPWHDAELVEIFIDRKNEDVIKLQIRWPEDYGGNSVIIEFISCYAFISNMNLGMVPPDHILTAECISESQELIGIKNKWTKMGLELNINCFTIVTNSTHSTLKIFSKNFRIIEMVK